MGLVYKTISVTPTVSASPDYSSGDQVGGIQTLTNACGPKGGRTAKLMSVTLIDNAVQSGAVQIFFFSKLPTVASSDNAALDLTDANMAYCVGHVIIATGDYQASASNSVASVKNIQLVMESGDVDGNLYAVAKTTSALNLGAVDDLTFKYAFETDA